MPGIQKPQRAAPTQKQHIPQTPQREIREFMNSRIHETTGEQSAYSKPEKFSTLLDPTLRRKVQEYAVQHKMKDYKVLELALREYFERHTNS